ncbi:MAG TPA: Type 1 glutamine amidotransferase-like domain-containing protein [Anaerolineales bacterium]|nr:Type 1 glutamine amidotransferase-like domain-containing protein [Anaerolineales bacterium]
MNLHLFSIPGDNLRNIVEASRPYLEDKDDPTIAYMPLASLYIERWQEETESAFKGLARLETINAELMAQKEIEEIIRRVSLVYIPGGNTFLLNHRLHVSGMMPYLQRAVKSGLPLVGFSAGTVLCGQTILTARDMNTVETPYFDGLKVSPFNFVAHYPLDTFGQSVKDEWLADYHFFHDNPVLMLCDDAYVKVEGKKATLVRGEAYVLRKDKKKEKVAEGESIVP